MTLAANKDFTLWVLGSHNRFFFFYQGHNLQTFKFILFQCTLVRVLPNENLSCNCSHDFKAEHFYHSPKFYRACLWFLNSPSSAPRTGNHRSVL